MESDLFGFMAMISNKSKKLVQNCYRNIFATEFAMLGTQIWNRSVKYLHLEILKVKMFELKQHGFIINFQDLLSQSKLVIADWTSVLLPERIGYESST
ncbi:hypothetical protein CCR75_001880 [Bremia lactucae]|uniref:Uncharacterized protein n=1 Tax=Bremia lactucae TaxID=4779 RepID=A0A976IDC9_BRELC|nr:hypothetical protein CCR75_001880 [Bremia lactucae]